MAWKCWMWIGWLRLESLCDCMRESVRKQGGEVAVQLPVYLTPPQRLPLLRNKARALVQVSGA
jgi:hypothetical protein